MRFEPDTISKRIRRKDEVKKVFFTCIYLVLIPVILFSLFLTLIELGKNTSVPELLDYEFYTVVSDSMLPKLKVDDIIIVKKNVDPKRVKVGNIISFKNEYGEIITHRVVEVVGTEENPRFITKGDNNEVQDNKDVDSREMVGRVVYVLPSYLLVLKNRVFFSAIVFILIAIIMVNVKFSKRKELRKLDRRKYERGC